MAREPHKSEHRQSDKFLTAADFEERIRLLEEVRTERSTALVRNSQYVLIFCSALTIICGVILVKSGFATQSGEYIMSVEFWAFISGPLMLGMFGVITALLLKPRFRQYTSLILGVFELPLLAFCLGALLFSNIANGQELIDMLGESLFWCLSVYVIAVSALFAASRVLSYLPGNKTAKVVVGTAAIACLILIILIIQNNFSRGMTVYSVVEVRILAKTHQNCYFFSWSNLFVCILHLTVCVISIAMIWWLLQDSEARSRGTLRVVFYAKAGFLVVFNICLWLGIFSVVLMMFRSGISNNATFWSFARYAFLAPAIFAVVFISDFAGLWAFHWWAKKADIELSRLKQELANFEVGEKTSGQ